MIGCICFSKRNRSLNASFLGFFFFFATWHAVINILFSIWLGPFNMSIWATFLEMRDFSREEEGEVWTDCSGCGGISVSGIQTFSLCTMVRLDRKEFQRPSPRQSALFPCPTWHTRDLSSYTWPVSIEGRFLRQCVDFEHLSNRVFSRAAGRFEFLHADDWIGLWGITIC